VDERWAASVPDSFRFAVKCPKVSTHERSLQNVRQPLEQLARDGELMAYRHDSFWQCMDTRREHQILEDLWASGEAPWRVWDNLPVLH